MTVIRFRVSLTGFSGAGGVNTWYATALPGFTGLSPATANGAGAALQTYYEDRKLNLQPDVVAQVDPVVDEIDIPTGQLVNSVAMSAQPPATTGTGENQGPHFTMLKVHLLTDAIRNGRRVRGGPFFGPVDAQAVEDNGNVNPGTVTSHETALAFVFSEWEAINLAPVVYSQPIPADRPNGPRDGAASLVTSASIWIKPAVLRSRRD